MFTSHLTLVTYITGCSDVDNSVFEDLLNFCIYDPFLSVFFSHATDVIIAKGH